MTSADALHCSKLQLEAQRTTDLYSPVAMGLLTILKKLKQKEKEMRILIL